MKNFICNFPCRSIATQTAGFTHNLNGTSCDVCIGAVGDKVTQIPEQFEVLTEQGFYWVRMSKATTPPTNAVIFGQENGKNMYLGRYNGPDIAYSGKFTDNYYFDLWDVITANIVNFDILVYARINSNDQQE